MSGHSHWATIRHKKEATDAKKGKAFSKVARLLMVAARDGGGSDPEKNVKLLYAMEKAREVNMPSDNVERAIKKGAGELDGVRLENTVYEGFGPAGVAVIIEALTDNRNRTVSEVRKIFESKGATMGGANSVSWMFDRKGLIVIPVGTMTEDDMIGVALEVGADDAVKAGDVFEVTCPPEDLDRIKKALVAKGLKPKSADISYIPKNYVTLDAEKAKKVISFMETLEEHDDVQNVYANFDVQE